MICGLRALGTCNRARWRWYAETANAQNKYLLSIIYRHAKPANEKNTGSTRIRCSTNSTPCLLPGDVSAQTNGNSDQHGRIPGQAIPYANSWLSVGRSGIRLNLAQRRLKLHRLCDIEVSNFHSTLSIIGFWLKFDWAGIFAGWVVMQRFEKWFRLGCDTSVGSDVKWFEFDSFLNITAKYRLRDMNFTAIYYKIIKLKCHCCRLYKCITFTLSFLIPNAGFDSNYWIGWFLEDSISGRFKKFSLWYFP